MTPFAEPAAAWRACWVPTAFETSELYDPKTLSLRRVEAKACVSRVPFSPAWLLELVCLRTSTAHDWVWASVVSAVVSYATGAGTTKREVVAACRSAATSFRNGVTSSSRHAAAHAQYLMDYVQSPDDDRLLNLAAGWYDYFDRRPQADAQARSYAAWVGLGRLGFRPAWRTSDVAALARGIWDGEAFDRMPILADALQDAGCDHPDILGYCQGKGPFFRGCWVLDEVLGHRR